MIRHRIAYQSDLEPSENDLDLETRDLPQIYIIGNRMQMQQLPHDAMHKRSLCRSAVFVRPSVCHVHVFCQNESE